MNLPKYPARDPLPSLDNIQSLINEANSFEACEFNREALRLTGQWHKEVDDYIQSSTANVRQSVFMKLWQAGNGDETIAKRVLVNTRDFEIASSDDEFTKVSATTITDLGMTAFGDSVGLVFVTGGDLSDDFNEGLFVPKAHARELKVSSHLFITNK